MGPVTDTQALEIAERFVGGLAESAGTALMIVRSSTIEHELGWVFFYVPVDPDVAVGGNAPILVGRRDGSVQVTGTAYPVEHYLEELTPREFAVVMEGWKPGLLKISLTKLIREVSPMGLAEAKQLTDGLLAGEPVRIVLGTAERAEEFFRKAEGLGVICRLAYGFGARGTGREAGPTGRGGRRFLGLR